MPDTPPAGFIDAAWWEVYGARLRAEQLAREAWIDALALAYRIVRMPASLDARQLAMQQDMIDRALGRKFYTTTLVGEWPR